VAREIVIDTVTRIEGHAKITIQLDDDGQVADAHFHVTQFRGFERIVQGRPVHELPSIMARICGICPVSHLIASAKACDEILATEPPPAGADLRRVLNLAQVVQSHALSFFHLSSPDLLFGFDAEPAGRHLFGVLGANPQLARRPPRRPAQLRVDQRGHHSSARRTHLALAGAARTGTRRPVRLRLAGGPHQLRRAQRRPDPA
jgi:NAD-reducing hydrogenase large subunit